MRRIKYPLFVGAFSVVTSRTGHDGVAPTEDTRRGAPVPSHENATRSGQGDPGDARSRDVEWSDGWNREVTRHNPVVSDTRGDFRRDVRARVLDAAHEHTVSRGWDKVRIGEVAVDAGVSRPTLYREFGSKDGVGQALVVREAERFFADVADIFSQQDDPATGVRAAVAFTLAEAAENPLLRAVLTADHRSEGLLPFLTNRADAIVVGGRAVIGDWIQTVAPESDPRVVQETAEAVVRLVVSHLVMPSMPAAAVADQLAHLTRDALARS